MEKLKECGVHLVEQLAECHIHSLATQRVQEAQEKWKASMQRLASLSVNSLSTYVTVMSKLYLHCPKCSATLALNHLSRAV